MLPITSDGKLDEVNLPTLTINDTKTTNERERTKTKSGEADLRSKKTKNETSMNNKESGKEELSQSKLKISQTETNNESTRNKSGEANTKSIGNKQRHGTNEVSDDFIYIQDGEQMIFLRREERKYQCPFCEKSTFQLATHL